MGRNVLCEKGFVLNASQAEEVFQLAEEKGVLSYRRYMDPLYAQQENVWRRFLIPVLLVQQHLSVQIWVILLLK